MPPDADPPPPSPPPAPPPPPPGPPPAVRRAPAGAAITPEVLAQARSRLKPVPPRLDYPLPAFYFKVVFATKALMSETAFQEVSGIGTEMDGEDVREGGENRGTLRLPTIAKHGPLVLSRAIAAGDSPLVTWCRQVMENGLAEAINTAELNVYLLNDLGDPVRAWTFSGAWPAKWDIDPFNSTKNEVAIEKIAFNYRYSTRLF